MNDVWNGGGLNEELQAIASYMLEIWWGLFSSIHGGKIGVHGFYLFIFFALVELIKSNLCARLHSNSIPIDERDDPDQLTNEFMLPRIIWFHLVYVSLLCSKRIENDLASLEPQNIIYSIEKFLSLYL